MPDPPGTADAAGERDGSNATDLEAALARREATTAPREATHQP